MSIFNYILESDFNKKKFGIDLTLPSQNTEKLVVFCHGFKGFKDWGTFPLIASRFSSAGFAFAKFNFSHNGTSIDTPTEFSDLESFGKNNFEIELSDLNKVISFFKTKNSEFPEFKKIYLIGHSRGGGIALLYTALYGHIARLCTWASVADFGKNWNEKFMQKAKQDGVVWVDNARTKQKMPLYFQLFENYKQNENTLSIPKNISKINCETLVIHGSQDKAVPTADAGYLKNHLKKSSLLIIENANHTFGGTHPYFEEKLPEDLEKVVDASISFFENVERKN